MSEKRRLDIVLTELGLADSRSAAQALIMSGKVDADGVMRDKASYMVADEASVAVRHDSCEFVSRGGLKLQHAFEVFDIDVAGKTGADIGASTGGFTDCLLRHGAEHVYAVDVGYGIISLKLRDDPRVTVMERMNARYLTVADFPRKLDFAVMDASFISLKLLLPPLCSIVAEDGFIVALIKPQFEAGRGRVGKNGVVRDKSVHIDVIRDILAFAGGIGLSAAELDASPITGPKGNIEYLLRLSMRRDESAEFDVPALVEQTHNNFSKR